MLTSIGLRKAIFEDGVNICPIAIRQDSRFGDAFWSETRFWHYLLRVMTSWALPLNITYLAPLTRQPQETNMDFAARAQSVIAEVVGVPAGQFDGSLYYSKTEQRRVRELQQEMCAWAACYSR
ncbi:unnamed protein product [Nippostrongylus brasiliensis]|uniref:NADPH-dependent FMN reductase n=1 Tax=Nippostrongylus brasiliensis TaxID=27835 RepID=A0A0N4YLG9_NIPBR|nr:unnamed protein product [Nippostrongylus brasiliensis]